MCLDYNEWNFLVLMLKSIFLHWFFMRLSVAIQFHAIVYLEPWTLHGYYGYKDASAVHARTKFTDDDGSKIKSRWGSCCTNRFFNWFCHTLKLLPIICDSWSVEKIKVSCITKSNSLSFVTNLINMVHHWYQKQWHRCWWRKLDTVCVCYRHNLFHMSEVTLWFSISSYRFLSRNFLIAH